MPFSSVQFQTGGAAVLAARGPTTTNFSTTFTLLPNQWYYLETTFQGTNSTSVNYNMVIANASSAGVIGSTLKTYNTTTNFEIALTTELAKTTYGAFKGFDSFPTAAGVMDNFYVSNTGVSLIPEPTAALLGSLAGLLLLRRRRN